MQLTAHYDQWQTQVQYDTVAVQKSAVCRVMTDCGSTSSDAVIQSSDALQRIAVLS